MRQVQGMVEKPFLTNCSCAWQTTRGSRGWETSNLHQGSVERWSLQGKAWQVLYNESPGNRLRLGEVGALLALRRVQRWQAREELRAVPAHWPLQGAAALGAYHFVLHNARRGTDLSSNQMTGGFACHIFGCWKQSCRTIYLCLVLSGLLWVLKKSTFTIS